MGVEGVAELVAWGKEQRPTNNSGSVARLAGEVVTPSQVQDAVIQGRPESKFTVAASPTRINQDNLFYRAHNPVGDGKCRRRQGRRTASPAGADLEEFPQQRQCFVTWFVS